ncbi:uncharacterized protein [Ptychodera flava]|uniref:uncharacterized protein n=1 Tax=Ptychodera flava TaxID=63121 RepID=UPI00396A7434
MFFFVTYCLSLEMASSSSSGSPRRAWRQIPTERWQHVTTQITEASSHGVLWIAKDLIDSAGAIVTAPDSDRTLQAKDAIKGQYEIAVRRKQGRWIEDVRRECDTLLNFDRSWIDAELPHPDPKKMKWPKPRRSKQSAEFNIPPLGMYKDIRLKDTREVERWQRESVHSDIPQEKSLTDPPPSHQSGEEAMVVSPSGEDIEHVGETVHPVSPEPETAPVVDLSRQEEMPTLETVTQAGQLSVSAGVDTASSTASEVTTSP